MTELEAGRELNTQVAQMMGVVACDNWRLFHAGAGSYMMGEPKCEHDCRPEAYWPPDYSGKISACG